MNQSKNLIVSEMTSTKCHESFCSVSRFTWQIIDPLTLTRVQSIVNQILDEVPFDLVTNGECIAFV